jgi:hypothetical protein
MREADAILVLDFRPGVVFFVKRGYRPLSSVAILFRTFSEVITYSVAHTSDSFSFAENRKYHSAYLSGILSGVR